MFHLCYGVSILYSEWKTIKDKEDSKFIRSLAECIWSTEVLMNRALDVRKITSRLPDRSPVHPCTPKKLGVMKSKYGYY